MADRKVTVFTGADGNDYDVRDEEAQQSIGSVPSGKTLQGQIDTLSNGIGSVPSGQTVEGQISALESGKVPTTRKVNNKALSSDITLVGTDIPVSSSDNTKVDSALESKVPDTRKVNNKALSSDINLVGSDIPVSSLDNTKLDVAITELKSALDNTEKSALNKILNSVNGESSVSCNTTSGKRYFVFFSLSSAYIHDMYFHVFNSSQVQTVIKIPANTESGNFNFISEIDGTGVRFAWPSGDRTYTIEIYEENDIHTMKGDIETAQGDISTLTTNYAKLFKIAKADDDRSNLFDTTFSKQEWDFVQLNDASTIHDWANGGIAPCAIGDTISFESQTTIRHFYVDVQEGDILKVKLRKPDNSTGNPCIVFTDSNGVVTLPLEMTDASLTAIERMYAIPSGVTRMYVMTQDVYGTNTAYTNIFKAQSKNLTEINNLSTPIIDGYWPDVSLNATTGFVQQYKSIKVLLDPGEYTVSFGTAACIVRVIYDGKYCQKTIKVPEGGCFSFRCLQTGYVGLSFISTNSSWEKITWNTWVQLEKGNSTIGKHNDTAIDVEIRKQFKNSGHLLETKIVKTKDLLNGYYNIDTYTESANRMTTFNWFKVSKGDLVIFLNKNIVVAFIYFDSNGTHIENTVYIHPGWISPASIMADAYMIEHDGYISMNIWDNSKGGSASLDPLDYDNILEIINLHDKNVSHAIYTKQAMLCNMKAKYCNVSINGQDGCVIGNKLYSFADGVGTAGPINIINLDTMENDGTGSHLLGHANTVDYDDLTDTLITYGSNGTNQPTIVLYQHPDFSDTLELSDSGCVVIPLYNESGFMNASAGVCFGECANIAYYMEGVYINAAQEENPVRNIYKILLGMGDNDLSASGYGTFISGKEDTEYNGTCKILKTYTGEIIPGIHCFENQNSLWTVQGMKFNGYLYVSYGTAGNNNLKIALNDQADCYSVVNNYHFEVLAPNGDIVPCEPELLALYKGKMYCGVTNRSIHNNLLYEIEMC